MFYALSRAANVDGSVIEQPTEQRLVNHDGLDLAHVHLCGLSPDEPALVDNTTIGDGKLRGPASKPNTHEPRNAKEAADSGSDLKSGRSLASFPCREVKKQSTNNPKSEGPQIDNPVKARDLNHHFASLKNRIYIAH